MYNIKVFDDCVHELSRLPGIGRKTATRLALHLLKIKPEDAYKLSDSIRTLKEKIKFCSECGSVTDKDICNICASNSRNKELLCIVEEAKDVFFIENTNRYSGLYHVLGGKISPIDGIGPKDLNFPKLIERVKELNVKEIIVATNPDVDGETTASYIARLLKDVPDLKITKLASGIPIGTMLEYTDEITVLRALENRIDLI